MRSEESEEGAGPARKDPVASIAGQVPHLSTGDRARLRRIYLTRSRGADGVVVGLMMRAGVEPPLPEKQHLFEPWRLLAHVAALLSGTGGEQPHAPGRRLGLALHAAGYSENRLLRLTAARGDGLRGQVIRAARMLAQAGERPVNLWSLFNLVGNDPDRAEQARIAIAQDYYAAQARSAGDAK